MATLKPVTFAIIGTGLIGPRHAETVVADPNATLLCIVDPDLKALSVAERFEVPHYTSVQAMLASQSRPEAAIVCTPNHLHVQISKELLEGGVHVLCEKPISTDIESGKELISCAKAQGRHLLVGHHRRFNKFIRAAKHHLPSLGRIIALSGLWTLYKPASYFAAPTDWRQSSTSGGTVFINLIHDVDLLRYLLGPITRVYAEATPSQRGFAAEEGAAITLRFASGAVGTFLLSDAVPSPFNFEAGTGENPTIPYVGRDFYRIFGSEGSLSVPDMRRWRYPNDVQKSWTESIQEESLDIEDGRKPFELQVEHFVKVIRGLEEPICSGEDGLNALVVCDAIRRVIQNGVPVNIEVDGL